MKKTKKSKSEKNLFELDPNLKEEYEELRETLKERGILGKINFHL